MPERFEKRSRPKLEQAPVTGIKVLRLSSRQMHLVDLQTGQPWHFNMDEGILKPGDESDLYPMGLTDEELEPEQDTFDSLEDAMLYGLWVNYSHDIIFFEEYANDPGISEETRKGNLEMASLLKKIVAVIDEIRNDYKSPERGALEIKLKELISKLQDEEEA